MAHQDASSLSKRLTILIGLSVIGAMTFGLAISFYRNLLFEETLLNLRERNMELRDQIDEGVQMLAYYHSRQYRDKYAKENLGKVNPGESVLILSEKRTNSLFEDLVSDAPSRAEQRIAAYNEFLQKIPTVEHWMMYLWNQQELTDIKSSF